MLTASAHSSHGYRSGLNLYFTFAAQPAQREQMRATYLDAWARVMKAHARWWGRHRASPRHRQGAPRVPRGRARRRRARGPPRREGGARSDRVHESRGALAAPVTVAPRRSASARPGSRARQRVAPRRARASFRCRTRSDARTSCSRHCRTCARGLELARARARRAARWETAPRRQRSARQRHEGVAVDARSERDELPPSAATRGDPPPSRRAGRAGSRRRAGSRPRRIVDRASMASERRGRGASARRTRSEPDWPPMTRLRLSTYASEHRERRRRDVLGPALRTGTCRSRSRPSAAAPRAPSRGAPRRPRGSRSCRRSRTTRRGRREEAHVARRRARASSALLADVPDAPVAEARLEHERRLAERAGVDAAAGDLERIPLAGSAR